MTDFRSSGLALILASVPGVAGHLIRFIWVVFILVTVANALTWWRRGRDHIARNPALRQGYKRLVFGFILWGNVPWVVMGLGLMVGGVSSPFDYCEPQSANPWVLAWYGTVVCLWALALWWIFAGGGARAIVDHPGLINIRLSKAWHVKLLACVQTLAGIVAMALAFHRDMPVP